MKKRLTGWRDRKLSCASRGQSVAEFAMLAPVLLLLLVGVADFGRVFYTAIELNNAARAGTQYGIQSPASGADTAGMIQAAQNDGSGISGLTATASEYCKCPDGTTQACSSKPCADMRVYVEVDTSATFDTLLNYPGIPASVSMNGKSVMREQ